MPLWFSVDIRYTLGKENLIFLTGLKDILKPKSEKILEILKKIGE